MMAKHKRTRSYNQAFVIQNLMGPNAMMLLEEMVQDIGFKPGMRILDLGCGTGLTSIFLAKEYGVHVFAYDLWISAAENKARFEEMGLDHLITPIHGDANAMPFANDYFDGVISIDSYHYYGSNDVFCSEKLLPPLKKDAIVAIAVPGMKVELGNEIPEEMKPYWDEESFRTWQTVDWWKRMVGDCLNNMEINEMACFDDAWSDWLSSDNPHAIGDRDMMKTDCGKYMNLISIIGTAKK